MRWTKALIPTLKEDPQDAEVISHKLMIRGGFIRKLISGAYTYLPLGLRVLKKVERIIREEMDSKGALEVLMPAIHPPEVWKQTGRYEVLGEVMIKFRDRHGKELVLGPTHEEIITDLVANNVRSYKELPMILYQIQTKFRDEPRPRFGVMRTSEFIMKDAYSFDCDVAGMEESYKKMYDAYCRIFARCGLPYLAVEADPGMMGGSVSHEFMVPSDAGEDRIVICGKCKYAGSVDVVPCKPKAKGPSKEKKLPIAEVETPGITTIEKVSALLKVGPDKLVKTLLYKADGKVVALLLRGDYEANETKIKNYLKCASLELADAKTIEDVSGAPVGFSGPVGLKNIRIIADNSVLGMANFVTGANKKDTHLINVNMGRDFETKEFADLRMIKADDGCPLCGKPIEIKQAIEVGHTFKLGTKYSDVLGAKVLDKDGKEIPAVMGCYGIGVTRILASVIETSNDKDGIIWPMEISPYSVIVIALNIEDKKVKELSEDIYKKLLKSGIEVLYDDRNESAGIKFKDADLIGIPVKVVIGSKNAKKDIVEIKDRKTGKVEEVAVKELPERIRTLLKV
ncbi:MAG: proline--tRNA ligase [Candidatus Omnitrophica bacterium]|nr:proline--tRNA ligase [Candidatus Omnitrophota bacterium]MCM8790528.1 proline--tRNA ligase [Candidatus Omnitrophota bacterium]